MPSPKIVANETPSKDGQYQIRQLYPFNYFRIWISKKRSWPFKGYKWVPLKQPALLGSSITFQMEFMSYLSAEEGVRQHFLQEQIQIAKWIPYLPTMNIDEREEVMNQHVKEILSASVIEVGHPLKTETAYPQAIAKAEGSDV